MHIVAERIKETAKIRGLSVRKMLNDIDYNKSYVSDMAAKGTSPSIDNLLPVALYLDVSLDYLAGRSDDFTPLSYRGPFQKTFCARLSGEIATLNHADVEAAGIELEELEATADINRALSFERACEVAEELGLSMDYLLGRTDNPEINK